MLTGTIEWPEDTHERVVFQGIREDHMWKEVAGSMKFCVIRSREPGLGQIKQLD